MDEYKEISDEQFEQLESFYYELIDEIDQLKQRVSNHFKQTVKVIYTKTEWSEKNDLFVEHIERHLKDAGMKKPIVVCRICSKNINQIYDEEKEEEI